MESKRIDFDGRTYRVTAAAKTPDRDAMASVAQLIGEWPSPEIMQEQGHDWQTSNGYQLPRLCGVSVGGSGSVCGINHVPAGSADKGSKAG
jgi:hypothetical protein